MSHIHGKDTKLEMLVRRGLHRRGFRFRLHDQKLPGRPDLVFPRHSAVIFVHGCFWHGHDCPLFRWPRSRSEFWREKITANRDRDRRATEQLQETGWRVFTIWECAFRGKSNVTHDAMLDRVAEWIASSEMEGTLKGEPYGHC